MKSHLRDFYQEHCFSGIYSSTVPHSFGVGGKVAGAVFAVGEIKDAIPVIHGPAGCGFHYRYNARRRYLPVYKAHCTNLEEKDIIFGGAEKLRSTILEIVRRDDPAMIVIVPSTATDMIHDEISSVLHELQPKIKTRLVAIQSEVFSHINKNTKRNNFQQWVKHWNKPEERQKNPEEFKGCGFGEAMTAMVHQVMEKQTVSKGSVNIEGFAWGAGGNAIVRGMAGMLQELGVTVNCLLPNCSTQDIVTAPRAELNIVRRVRWAKQMQNIFGTGWFSVGAPADYQGLDGIERFYLTIAEKLEIRKEAFPVIAARKYKAEQDLQAAKEFLKQYRFGLYCHSIGSVASLITAYEKEYGLPLEYVCVELNKEKLDINKVGPDTVALAVSNMRDALAKTGSRAQVIMNPDAGEWKQVLSSVDFMLGDREHGIRSAKTIPHLAMFNVLDFDNFCNVVLRVAETVKKAILQDELLIDKFRYDSLSYPLLREPAMASSHLLWRKMWLLRGEEA